VNAAATAAAAAGAAVTAAEAQTPPTTDAVDHYSHVASDVPLCSNAQLLQLQQLVDVLLAAELAPGGCSTCCCCWSYPTHCVWFVSLGCACNISSL
jgi:hypothetical protein